MTATYGRSRKLIGAVSHGDVRCCSCGSDRHCWEALLDVSLEHSRQVDKGFRLMPQYKLKYTVFKLHWFSLDPKTTHLDAVLYLTSWTGHPKKVLKYECWSFNIKQETNFTFSRQPLLFFKPKGAAFKVCHHQIGWRYVQDMQWQFISW